MTNHSLYHCAHAQRGIALATALIFLVVITILGLVAVRSSTTELQLANNAQVSVEALQNAQAVVDAVIQDPDNLPVNGALNYMRCYSSGDNGSQKQCPEDNSGLTLPTLGDASGGDDGGDTSGECDPAAGPFQTGTYAEARRVPPADVPVPAALLTSMDKFQIATFSVRGQYACGKSGLGAADIEQGVIKLVPKHARLQ